VPQQVVENFSLRNSSVSGLLWIIDAEQGVSYGAGEPVQLTGMRVRFHDGHPEVRSVLTSKRGEVQEATQALYARDSVVVWTPGGDTLRTESLRWDPRTQKIQTDDYFTLTRGRDRLTGVGLDADPDLTRYVVKKEVRAEVRDEGGPEALEERNGREDRGR
jgi:LPS export ABC transporter protein LptC